MISVRDLEQVKETIKLNVNDVLIDRLRGFKNSIELNKLFAKPVIIVLSADNKKAYTAEQMKIDLDTALATGEQTQEYKLATWLTNNSEMFQEYRQKREKRENTDNLLKLAKKKKSKEALHLLQNCEVGSVDVNVIDKKKTPLHFFSKSKNLALIQELLRHGAKPLLEDTQNNTPISLAIDAESWDIVDVLIDCAIKTELDNNLLGKEILRLAKKNQFDKVKKIFAAGFQPKLYYFDGTTKETVLHLAAKAGDLTLIKMLMATNIKNGITEEKEAALSLAARYNHPAVVDYLFEVKLQPKEENDVSIVLGKTLVYLMSNKQFELAIRLLKTSITDFNTNARVVDSHCTALHFAVVGKMIEIINLLVTRNANINQADKQGQTPLDIAISQSDRQVIGALLQQEVSEKCTEQLTSPKEIHVPASPLVEIVNLPDKEDAHVEKSTKKDDVSPPIASIQPVRVTKTKLGLFDRLINRNRSSHTDDDRSYYRLT